MTEEETPPRQPGAAAGPDRPLAAMAPEISRRVGSILDAVEREASRLRDEAQAEAARYGENARRHADGLVAERQRRISELSDELIAKSEAVVARLDDAAPVRQGFENLVRALGDAAERLSHESEAARGDFAAPPFHEGARPQPPEMPPQQPPAYRPAPQQPPAPAVPSQHRPPPRPIPFADPPAYGEQPPPPPPPWQPPTADPGPPPPPAPPAPQQPPPLPPAAPGTTWRDLDDARIVALQMATSGRTRGDVRAHLQVALAISDPEPTLDDIYGPDTDDDARAPWTTGRS